jgi:hypothetical protein
MSGEELTIRTVTIATKGPLPKPQIDRKWHRCLCCKYESGTYWAEKCPRCKSLNCYVELPHVDVARMLLEKHKLTVPDNTTEMIAKTIARRYELELKPKKGPSPRERMKKALAHAAKLLEYTERGTGGRRLHDAISTRSASLHWALSDVGVVIWLATAATPIDVAEVLDGLTSRLSKEDLTRLIQALQSTLSETGKSGRPRGETTYVVRGACIAWLRAGHRDKYTWDEFSESLKGPLSEFARELLDYCNLAIPGDNALYCALRVALPDCEELLRSR